MNITDIKSNPTQVYEKPNFRIETRPEKQTAAIQDKVEISSTASSWQKDILLNALESLENNIQPANNHPLAKLENRPIETYNEAMAEMAYLRTDKFLSEASPAQANIDHSSFMALFSDEIA